MKDENENGLPDFFENFENWSKLADTDVDGLPDSIEEYLGSDPNNIDTDGDGLNDFYEVFGTYTDPTKADTDDNGANDGDEDFDEDGLTNLEEFDNKTNPYIADTDSDGLSDGDEVKTHGTDPLVADTDGDGLDNGDEIVLGTNPLVQDTDGDGIIDSKEKIQQTFTHKVKNEDCAVTEVIVDMECTGNINRTTSVESVMNVDILCTDVVGLVGEPFEIETTSEFDKATLTFKIDKNKLGEIPFDNLLFLWYNEEENRFDELETILDEDHSTVSIVTTHFSKYMVVDRQAWFDNWREIYARFEKLSEKSPSITAICVDCSGSMSTNDPFFYIEQYTKTCYRDLAVQQFVEAMFANDKTSIITFASSAKEVCPLTSDKELLNKNAKFYSSGGTNTNAAINIALQQLVGVSGNKSIILMSDGDVNVSNSNLEDAKSNNIKIHAVALGQGANSSALQKCAKETKGEFFIVKTAVELKSIYDKLSAENQFNFGDLPDSDGDGVPDDIEISGVPMPSGKLVFPDPTNPDTDGDGLSDGDEVGKLSRNYVPSDVPDCAVTYKFCFDVTSDPTLEDSDYDGIDDDVEGINKHMNNEFSVTWNPDSKENDVLYENISYIMDYSQFFNKKIEYNGKISTASSLMAALAYDDQSLVGCPDATEDDSYVDQFLRKHGMKDVKTYKLADRYDDQHITDVTFGHRWVKYDRQIKEIIAVVIRGTNGTVEEWFSNFDIGCDSIYEGNGLIPKNEDWEIKENHMGFDIAATRVIKLLDEYLSQAENLDQSAKKTLWITGHSRGAAISNIVGSRLDSKYETFVYAFATPKTTTVSEEIARSHESIFNIINSDDIIPDMPLDFWNFRHYGKDIPISVVKNYSDEWKSYVGKSYVSNQEKKEKLVKSFETLAEDRNDCYEFHCSCHGDGEDKFQYTAEDYGCLNYGEFYCAISSDFREGMMVGLRCETTAYFMQYLAILTAKQNIPTALTDVAKQYEDTKWKFIRYSKYIENPHQPISYHLLSKM